MRPSMVLAQPTLDSVGGKKKSGSRSSYLGSGKHYMSGMMKSLKSLNKYIIPSKKKSTKSSLTNSEATAEETGSEMSKIEHNQKPNNSAGRNVFAIGGDSDEENEEK